MSEATKEGGAVAGEIESRLENLKKSVVSDDEARRRREEAKNKETSERTRELLDKSGIPQRHRNTTVNPGEDWWGRVLKWLEESGTKGYLVILYGVRNSGKTQLAVEACKHAAVNRRDCLYIKTARYFMELKATYQQSSRETEADVIRRYTKPALLVLDEAQERSESHWESVMLNLLIDERYDAMKDTVVIANATTDGLQGLLGTSILRRCRDTGGAIELNEERKLQETASHDSRVST